MDKKDTNPKDAVGVRKVPMSTVPKAVLAELGLAMLEGSLIYGRFNYRVAGVRASVYIDALNRHMMAWEEGEDIDPNSGLSHITKAIASLVVLRDGMIQGNWVDDRPPKSKANWAQFNREAERILDSIPDREPPYTEAEFSAPKSILGRNAKEAKGSRDAERVAGTEGMTEC